MRIMLLLYTLTLFGIILFSMAIEVGCSPKHAAVVDLAPAAAVYQVKVTWQSPPVADSTRLYRSVGPGAFQNYAQITGTSYIDSNIKRHTAYHYRAQTVCNACSPSVSVMSNTVSIQIP